MCYAGSRVTSITHPSRLGWSRFNKAIVKSGIRIRPFFCILTKKLSLTPKKPTIVTVTFKTSDDSSLYSHRTSLGTCRRFCFCNTVLKLTLWLNGNLNIASFLVYWGRRENTSLFFLVLPRTSLSFCVLSCTQPANNLSFASKKQPKTIWTKNYKKCISLARYWARNSALCIWVGVVLFSICVVHIHNNIY